jgi:hypothetical protein
VLRRESAEFIRARRYTLSSPRGRIYDGICSYLCFSSPSPLDIVGGSIYVANFTQEVMKRQLPQSVEGLRGQGVEQFGRSETLVPGLDDHLFFLDHVHEFDADESGLSRVERFES